MRPIGQWLSVWCANAVSWLYLQLQHPLGNNKYQETQFSSFIICITNERRRPEFYDEWSVLLRWFINEQECFIAIMTHICCKKVIFFIFCAFKRNVLTVCYICIMFLFNILTRKRSSKTAHSKLQWRSDIWPNALLLASRLVKWLVLNITTESSNKENIEKHFSAVL